MKFQVVNVSVVTPDGVTTHLAQDVVLTKGHWQVTQLYNEDQVQLVEGGDYYAFHTSWDVSSFSCGRQVFGVHSYKRNEGASFVEAPEGATWLCHKDGVAEKWTIKWGRASLIGYEGRDLQIVNLLGRPIRLLKGGEIIEVPTNGEMKALGTSFDKEYALLSETGLDIVKCPRYSLFPNTPRTPGRIYIIPGEFVLPFKLAERADVFTVGEEKDGVVLSLCRV